MTRLMAAIGFAAAVGTAAMADYLSSWLPGVGGFPAGAIIRDTIAVLFVLLAGTVLLGERSGWSWSSLKPGRSRSLAGAALVPFAAFGAWVLLLVLPSPALVPAVLAARNLLLFVMVGFAAYVLVAQGLLSTRALLGTLTVVGFVAAVLGILDTVSRGEIVSSLGYRRDYSGVEGTAAILISGTQGAFQGYVRASGGISNALVFGYLMAAIAVFAIWMAERAVVRSGWGSRATLTYLVLATLAGVACLASLTRGAMIALVVGLILLVVLRRSRPILVATVLTMAMAILLTLAGSRILSTQSTDNATAPGPTPAPGQAAPTPSAGPDLIDTLGSRVSSSDLTSQESSEMRLEQARRGIASLAARPMGNGLGTEGSASNRAAQPGIASDNFALVVALQTGLFGALLYALIFAAMIAWAARHRGNGRELLLAMIGLFAIAATFSAAPDAPVFATTIWVLILAVSAAATIDDRSGQPVTSPL